ncbi:MAG: hypothetical protein JWQ59_1300 [Cryobacterium sp.]|nr:hypothetical protein [Cryobacterium sp.]
MCGTVTLSHTQTFSPVDEWVYYDYVTKIPTQGVVHQGEVIGEPALAAMACFGDLYGPQGQPCTGLDGDSEGPAGNPQAGKTTADIYTPFYFALTWLGGKALQLVTGLDFLTAARLTGSLWLASGILAFYGLLRELKIKKLAAVAIGLIVIGSVASRYAFTYISTDAPSFLFGALTMLVGLRFLRGRSSGWLLIPLTTVAVLFKVTNIFVVGLLALTFVIAVIARRMGSARPGMLVADDTVQTRSSRLILVAALFTASPLVAEVVWLRIRSAISVGPQPNQGLATPLSPRGLSEQVVTFFQLTGSGTIDGLLSASVGLLLVAGVFGYFLTRTGSGVNLALSTATLASGLVFAPILLFAMSVALGSSFPIPQRYNASLLPAFYLALAMVVRNRMATYLLLGLGTALIAIAIFRAPLLP